LPHVLTTVNRYCVQNMSVEETVLPLSPAIPDPQVEIDPRLALINSRQALIKLALQTHGPAGSYKSDSYFVSAWVTPERPEEEAMDLARDPLTIFLVLHFGCLGIDLGLEAILADRHASAGLKKCLTEKHAAVRKALASYITPPKPKGKRGPRPFKDGKTMTALASEMLASGSDPREISREFYNDPTQTKRVKALLFRAKKTPKPTATEK
jgi:hypothetical protein